MTILHSVRPFPSQTVQGVLREQFVNSPAKAPGDETKFFVPVVLLDPIAFIYQRTLISLEEALAAGAIRKCELEDVYPLADTMPDKYRIWNAGMLSFRLGVALINNSILLAALPVQAGGAEAQFWIVLTEALGGDPLTDLSVEQHPYYRRFGGADGLVAVDPEKLPSFIQPHNCVDSEAVRKAWIARPTRI